MDKGKLLERMAVSGEERILLAKVLDRMEQARNRNIPVATDFLSPQEQAMARDLLQLANVSEVVFSGGYVGAERQMALFLPDWMESEDAQPPLRVLRAIYRPEYALSHRDLLGSLMGLGVARERVGDLLVGPERCDLVVADSIAEFLLQNWETAGRANLQVTAIESWELEIPAVTCEELRDTVSSLRLDAIASTGFRLSRSKAAALIEGGRVQVNWRDCVKPDYLLTQGDAVSARGYGKFELAQVGGITKKGRTVITVKRYV